MKKHDLTPYMIESRFKREFNTMFGFWEKVMLKRARNPKRIQNRIENFCGEFLDRFENLAEGDQKMVVNSEFPFWEFTKIAKMDFPQFFDKLSDNQQFIEVIKTHKFK